MLNLLDFQKQFGDEKQCLDYLEKVRWAKERVCPHCKGDKTYKFSDGFLFKCAECQKQFTVKIGTIFSDSKIPLTKWFMVIYLATSLKKGISSMQVSRYLGVTQKTAWFMLQRIRYALEKASFDMKDYMKTVIEADETYIGGKGGHNKRGRGAENKTPVVGLAEREGKIKAEAVSDTKGRTVQKIIRENVQLGSVVITDEYPSYYSLSKLGYIYGIVNHAKKEYVNTIEGFWSQLKRGIDGIYHHVSPKHLQKYCKEYEYRFNTRKMNDFDRFTNSLGKTEQRLTYKKLVQ